MRPRSCHYRHLFVVTMGLACLAWAAGPGAAQAPTTKPNILVIFGDDIGQTNVSAYSMGLMGYRTPNIDRIAREGMILTDRASVALRLSGSRND